MAWLLDIFKEVPLSAVLKERLAQADERLKRAEEENVTLREQVDKLTAAVASLKGSQRFITRNGVKWADDGGGFRSYCPTCELALSGIPASNPDVLKCSKCKFRAPFHPLEEPVIAASLSTPGS
jgi:hypothetical protein